jgi:hypothetical protein
MFSGEAFRALESRRVDGNDPRIRDLGDRARMRRADVSCANQPDSCQTLLQRSHGQSLG